VIIIGFYLALNASGLSTLAISLLGGTGMIGIGIGLALKNSFENYTSSLMISLNELLRIGEVVNINGNEGVVQSVTTKGTTLMDYSGNNIIIPNTQVFNSVIKNLTRNPNVRSDFTVGIGYDDSIDEARKIIHAVLKSIDNHVLQDPEPLVAVDSLGASTVNIKVYFWINAVKSSVIKLRSTIIQNVKEALMDANISMPDDAREVVFASPLKIEKLDKNESSQKNEEADKKKITTPKIESDENIDLSSEIDELKEQVSKMPPIDEGENLV
jgi:small-conductance mechanosensitive channel